MNYIDLFSGTGGFKIAFDKNGFNCVFSNDINKNSEIIYKLNNTESDSKFVLNDIHNLKIEDIPDHNILCAGFPCQPFSIAGEKKGFDDERSNVFWKLLDIIKLKNPSILLLENVKNLLSHDNNNTFNIILNELIKLNYKVVYSVLDTCKVSDIPQHRERIYILCIKNTCKNIDFFDNFFDELIQKNVKNKKIEELLEQNVPDKYYYDERFVIYPNIKDQIKTHISENKVYQYRRHYVRENKNNCVPTLTANMGTGGHNVPLILDDKGIRKLTPRECFNFQGFPSDYKLPPISDSELYKLAGNAISIPVVEQIAEKIKYYIEYIM